MGVWSVWFFFFISVEAVIKLTVFYFALICTVYSLAKGRFLLYNDNRIYMNFKKAVHYELHTICRRFKNI